MSEKLMCLSDKSMLTFRRFLVVEFILYEYIYYMYCIPSFVQSGDPEVITFLIETQIFPGCLNSMEVGCELSKTVSA